MMIKRIDRHKRTLYSCWLLLAIALALLVGCSLVQPPAPTVVPTPDESAFDGQVLILVANFQGEGGAAAADELGESLRTESATADLMVVTVRRAPDDTPTSSEEAQALGESVGANLVVWGEVSDGEVSPVYEMISGYEREALVGLPSTIPVPPPAGEEGRASTQLAYLTLYGLGKTATFNQNYDEAINLFSRAFDLPVGGSAPNLGLAYFYRGYSYQFTDQPQEALADYTRAIDHNPDAYYAYINRGYLRQTVNGELDPALADYRAAVDLLLDLTDNGIAGTRQQRDALVVAYNNAIQIHLRQEDWESMIATADDLLAVAPGNVRALSYRGTAREEMGDLAGALADYNAALDNAPDDIYALASRGSVYDQMGRRDKALDDYEHFFDLASGNEYFYAYIQERYEALTNSAS